MFRGRKKEDGGPSASEPSSSNAEGHLEHDLQSSSGFISGTDTTPNIISSTPEFGNIDLGSIGAPSGERLYNPYEGIGAALDRRDVKAPFRLPSEPEFLFSEEAIVKRRSWSENLTYYTGTGYLVGAAGGGGFGAYRALSSPVAVTTGGGMPSQRIRVNQLLNTSGKLGRSAGNSLGVLGLLFSSTESMYYHVNDARLPDDLMTIAAGATTGAIFRSVRGPKQAVAAAALGSMAGTILLGARKYVSSGL